MRIVSISPLFNSDFKAGNTIHHLLYRADKDKVLRFVIMIIAFHLVCACTIRLFYTLYDSTEIPQVNIRNVRECGKVAEKANEAG
jgi:hypothetical protein